MNTRILADHVSSFGRKGDTTLVHMAPEEVVALQKLAEKHGTTLTINPHTGLPEANPLLALLPLLAGAGAETAGLSAFVAPIATGLAGWAATGSLEKGLSMGLGAFGGGGIARGLMGLGRGAMAPALSGIGSLPGRVARSAVPNSVFNTANSFLNPTAIAQGSQAAQQAGISAGQAFSPLSTTSQQIAQQALTPVQNFQNMGRGIGTAVRNPGALVDQMGGGMGAAMYGGAALAPFMSGSSTSATGPGGFGDTRTNTARLAPDFFQRPMYSGQPNTTYYSRGFNSGGPVGFGSLGMYSDGGQVVKGPGDGMSDSIPARINNGGEARLTTEEFVVPADVVSGLGNGSSSAGASRLYEMMDRVRQSRTGTTRQAPAINPYEVAPA